MIEYYVYQEHKSKLSEVSMRFEVKESPRRTGKGNLLGRLAFIVH